MPDPSQIPHGPNGWWQLLWASPLTFAVLGFKRSREFLAKLMKLGQPDSITRDEFEPRIKAVVDEIHFVHGDLSDKLMAHTAQARQDARDNRKWMEDQFKEQFNKIDNFTTQVLLNQKNK